MKGRSGVFAPGALARWLLRLVCAGLLLAAVFRFALPEDQGLDAVRGAFAVGGPALAGYIAAAFALFGSSFVVGTVRFSLLLRAAGIEIGFAVLFRALIVAGFFNLVLPGAILGDVYRVWDVRREAGEGAGALGVLVVERLLGFAALGAVGLLAAPWIPLEGDSASLAAALLLLCSGIAIGNGLALHPRGQAILLAMVAGLERAFPRFARHGADRARRVLDATRRISQQGGTLRLAFLLSLVNQGLPVVAVYVLAQSLGGEPVAAFWFAVIVPFVTLMSLVPISLGGTGVREGLYVVLFGAVGMSAAAALALSLTLLATALVWAAIGLALFVLGPRPTRAPAEDAAV